MNQEEVNYLDSLRLIIREGFKVEDRTGVGTRALAGLSFKYDLTDNKIPIWTTRKIKWENQFWELIWFLRGDTSVKWLQDRGVNIWNSWVKEDGTIGPGYGKQWRNIQVFESKTYSGFSKEIQIFQPRKIDQFENLIAGIKSNYNSRRHIVTLWNPAEMDQCVLPCCHGNVIQFVVEEGKFLHCLQTQRSADMPLGYCPWQYAMLTHIVAGLTNLKPKSLTVMVGNAHVYNNQLESLQKQLERVPTTFPTFYLNKKLRTIDDVTSLTLEDVSVKDYNPQSFIKFPIAI